MDDLASVRRKLADSEHALRVAEDDLASIRLRVELSVINAAGGDPKAIGSNEEERKRAYRLACESDDDYVTARNVVRIGQYEVAKLQTERSIYLDSLTERDLQIRALAVGLPTQPDESQYVIRQRP